MEYTKRCLNDSTAHGYSNPAHVWAGAARRREQARWKALQCPGRDGLLAPGGAAASRAWYSRSPSGSIKNNMPSHGWCSHLYTTL
jgi:hypothetical protein